VAILDQPAGFTDEQAQALLNMARGSIGHRLGLTPPVQPPDDPALHRHAGVFVTLLLANKLRGCIGTLEPVDGIADAVMRNSVAAAFSDHRFAPLTAEEYEQITIELSVLSATRPLSYETPEELPGLLRPGIDGVILAFGSRRATFLPQVWQQLPDAALFLRQLSIKAGREPSAWQTQSPDVLIYQVDKLVESP
jgi:AmmeMemoRadiSam system protein A